MSESLKDEQPKYDKAWFRERAISSVNTITDNEWDYSDSLLMYLPGHDETYESVQNIDNPYYEIVTAPERAYLENVAPKIADTLPDNFDYVDLGPGTEHKEQFIFDEARKQGKSFVYLPVDISKRYLDLSVNHSEEQGITAKPVRSSFEELPLVLNESDRGRFVSLGLTYSNYNPEEILKLLKKIRGNSGNVFINSQIRDRVDTEKLRSIYQEVAVEMSVPKLKLLGLDPDKDVSDLEVTDEVRMWYTIKNTNPTLEAKGIKSGDRILLFQSLRPTLEELNNAVAKEFDDYDLLDTGDSFVGVVTK